jgi:hypothetical protein
MGRGDNRLTLKMRQRNNQKRKKLNLRNKIEEAKKAKKTSPKKRDEEK